MSETPVEHRPMMRCMNPLTMGVSYLCEEVKKDPPSLQSLCMEKIKKMVTIKRMNRIEELELPKQLTAALKRMCLNNFYINPDEVTGKHHQEQVFPAICTLDSSRCYLKIVREGEEIVPDPGVLSQFKCNDIMFCVYDNTITLADKIQMAKQTQTFFPEQVIWKAILDIARLALMMSYNTSLDPSHLHYKDGEMFHRETRIKPGQHMMQTVPAYTRALYEAPEILTSTQPFTERALSWTVACIAYEMGMLTPAFYDAKGRGNLNGIVRRIIKGAQPRELKDMYTDDLKIFIQNCLQRDINARPSLQDIIDTALARLGTEDPSGLEDITEDSPFVEEITDDVEEQE